MITIYGDYDEKVGYGKPRKLRNTEEIFNNIMKVGHLYEDGNNIPQMGKILDQFSSRQLQHYKDMYVLYKKAFDLRVESKYINRLKMTGLKFANCAGVLCSLNGPEFIKAFEFCLEPLNKDVLQMRRDDITVYVRRVVEKKLYQRENFYNNLHNKLVRKQAREFLFNNLREKIPSATEVCLEPNFSKTFSLEKNCSKGLRIDVLGFSKSGDLYGVEVKTSITDFHRGLPEIEEYYKYCHFLYIFTTDKAVLREVKEIYKGKVGVVYFDLPNNCISLADSFIDIKRNIPEVNQEKLHLLRYSILCREFEKNYK